MFGLIGAALALSACAGGGADVYANTSRYPISFSSALPDAAGTPLHVDRELEIVGKVHMRYRQWYTLYGSVPGKPKIDLSDEINRQVDAAHGEGVAELAVGAKQCGANWVAFLRFLPFWPGCLLLDVDGKIVRTRG